MREEEVIDRNWPRWGMVLLWCVFGGVAMMLTGAGGLWVWIEADVDQACAEAMQRFPGKEVGALIAQVESDATTMREKNRAIWALGRLGDRRALPALDDLVTGEACNHARYVCQRELLRAIKLIEKKSEP